jgi:phenylalanyl-tRNA synthetase alpha subunit
MNTENTENQQTRKFNEVMRKLQANSEDATKSLTDFIEEIRTQAIKQGDNRSLTDVMEDIQTQAEKRGLTEEILKAILEEE